MGNQFASIQQLLDTLCCTTTTTFCKPKTEFPSKERCKKPI